MRKDLPALILLLLFGLSCQKGLDITTTKQTASDPIADITYLNGYFYTTNFDKSANAGTQIDLYKFNDSEPSIAIDRFELPLNGQGYLAMANDGTNLYFQSRFTDLLFKISPLGEIFWVRSDRFEDNESDSTFMYWTGRGLTVRDSNLVALYRYKNDSTRYRWRFLDLNNDSLKAMDDVEVTWEHLNDVGAFALEYNPINAKFLVLAKDILDQTILFEVDSYFQIKAIRDTLEGNPVGISINENLDLYLSYTDRRIEKLTD